MSKLKKPKEDYGFTIEKISENPDGSAECLVHMTDFVKSKLIERGVIEVLKDYINQENKKIELAGRNKKTSRDCPDVCK